MPRPARTAEPRDTPLRDTKTMTLTTRRPWWAALTLAALTAGCSGSEDATTATPNTSPTTAAPTAGPAPETPLATPATNQGEMKAAPGSSADAAKSDTSAEKKGDAGSKEEMPKVEAPKVDSPKGDAAKDDASKKDAAKTASVKLEADEIAEIKKLPAGEQDMALKQAVCPASGEHLGSMGTPIKVSAEGKTFYLCCKNCEKEVKADPKSVVAKLKDQ